MQQATSSIEKNDCTHGHKCCNGMHGGTSNSVYGFGVIGAIVYFYPTMGNFSEILLAIGKSLVWPALLVYQAMNLLKM